MTSRRPRGRRVKGRALVLTERDYDLLFMLAEHRYLATDQVARELFPTPDRCRRRVRQLYDAGYLAVTLVSSTSPNVLSLARDGVRALEDVDPTYAEAVRLPGAMRQAGISHHLACADTRMYVQALAEQRGEVLARWSNNGGAIGRHLGLAAWHLEPDGLADIELASGSVVTIACEVDCGTETVRVLNAKLARYAAVFEADPGLDELWVVVASGEGRLRTIVDLVHAEGLEPWTRVMPLDHLTARPVRAVADGAARIGHQRPNSVDEHRRGPVQLQRVTRKGIDGDRGAVRGG